MIMITILYILTYGFLIGGAVTWRSHSGALLYRLLWPCVISEVEQGPLPCHTILSQFYHLSKKVFFAEILYFVLLRGNSLFYVATVVWLHVWSGSGHEAGELASFLSDHAESKAHSGFERSLFHPFLSGCTSSKHFTPLSQ